MSCVYVIGWQDGGPVKVGIAANPKKRLKSLQTSAPQGLEIFVAYVCPDRTAALGIERLFHKQHSVERMTGEWFKLASVSAAEAICAIIEANEWPIRLWEDKPQPKGKPGRPRSDRPKSQTLHVRFEPWELIGIEETARKSGLKTSEWVRLTLIKAVNE